MFTELTEAGTVTGAVPAATVHADLGTTARSGRGAPCARPCSP